MDIDGLKFINQRVYNDMIEKITNNTPQKERIMGA